MFKDREIICFLGDSITANGRWMAEVYQYLRKKYKVKCYNCGFSGGTALNASYYLNSECLIYNPDHVSIMFGINDIRISLYGKDDENAKQKKEAIDTCVEKYTEIVEKIIASGAKPIICIPVPYDEVTVSDAENCKCQCGLDAIEKELRLLADKYDCPLVDFKRAFMPLLGKEEVMCPDRVHPTDKGQHVMAQTFLADIGEKEKADFDEKFEFEEWNKQRFDAEQRLHMMNFVEFAAIFENGWLANKTNEEKKQMVRKIYEEREIKTDFIALAFLSYIDNIDIRSRLLGDVVGLTIF